MNNQPDAGMFDDMEDDGVFDKPTVDQVDEKPLIDRLEKRDPAESPTFKTIPCPKCNGTGKWVGGYANPTVRQCFKCNGTGRVVSSKSKPLDMSPEAIERRAKAKVSRQRTKMLKADELQERYRNWIENDDLGKFLVAASGWSGFAMDMTREFAKKGELTAGQLQACRSMKEKVDARGDREADADLSGGNLDEIFKIFTHAIGSGLKRPKLRIGDMAIKLAPAGGRNVGHLYVMLEGEYQGKIDPEGKFFASRDADEGINERLVEISADPLAAAVLHGKQTGNCACCGRVLTDPKSVERGVGPYCAERWGL